jgi:pimeloyl-ACP methyl ester carboxylesterase
MTAKSNQIILSDGRRLGFSEYGDTHGQPLMYFHGWPSSRLEAGMAAAAAQSLNMRIIAPDRPGFGLSDFKSARELRDWPADVVELADALDLDRFSIMGISGGGPYAVACALEIPQRLFAAGIVSGSGPADTPGFVDAMRPQNLRLLNVGRRAPWLVRILAWQEVRAMRRDPDGYFEALSIDLPMPDQEVLARDEIRECLLKAGLEAFRRGSRGAALENSLYAKSWGFNLQEITKEIHLWHGERDINSPPAMGRYLASSLPNCRSRFYEDEGHISTFVNHMDEILHTLNIESGA